MKSFFCRNFISYASLVLYYGVTLLTNQAAGRPSNGPPAAETPISFDEFRRVLDANPFQYSIEFGALFDGDELYRLEGDLRPDCRATIMAYTRMVLNWTSYPDFNFGLILNNLVDSKEPQHPFESICQTVQVQINKTSKVGDFVRLKETLKASSWTKPKYYFDKLLETGQDMEAAVGTILRIHGVAKITANGEFFKVRHSQRAYTKEAHVLARSVETVANKGKYRAQIQRIYDQVLEEMTEVIGGYRSRLDLELKGYQVYSFTPTMLQLLQKRLEEDPDLKLELENAKKLVQATLQHNYSF